MLGRREGLHYRWDAGLGNGRVKVLFQGGSDAMIRVPQSGQRPAKQEKGLT